MSARNPLTSTKPQSDDGPRIDRLPSDPASTWKLSLGGLVVGAVVGFVAGLLRPRSWR